LAENQEPEFHQDVTPMKRTRLFGWLRWATILVALALAAFAIVAIRSLREPVLRAAGWALVVNNESAAPADIIVLTIDSDGAGALEAADLVQSGVSKRVAVFKEPPTAETTEFVRRGLPYEDAGTRQIRQLTTLGVTDVVQISRVNGTGDEGQVLPQWTDEQHLRSIVVVATKDHSRRLRRVLDRAMKGHPTHFTVQAARYSSFDPDRWWETRKGVRTEIVELQKLLLDFVLHPLSFLTSSLSMQRQKGLPVSGGADPWPPPPDQESHHLWRLDAGQSGVPLNEPCWSGRFRTKRQIGRTLGL
jgi:uncharacterized SAM-binding protein YcdF (DUF218 family)